MIISMKAGASRQQVAHVIEKIESYGFKAHPIFGEERVVIGAIGDDRMRARPPGKDHIQSLESAPGVDSVMPILKPFKLVGRELKKEKTCVRVGDDIKIGNSHFVVMAGPCSVESREQLLTTAHAVKAAGARVLRGGAYKPRTSPYDFQGLEEEGLKLLAEAREMTGLKVVTEVLSDENVSVVAAYADILQVGARNMQNFALLKKLGKCDKPVLLKRGMSSTIKEFLLSAEYIVSQGNANVILCERGIRTFETYTRNTLDLAAVPLLNELSHLPVIIDPSHATGKRSLVKPMAKAAVAAGADGLLIEVHPNPEEAFSDGPQSLLPEEFVEVMSVVRQYAALENREV
jgi:3-deoxy-7-phosphoheptulonate synthase